jgi:hypothetical protein
MMKKNSPKLAQYRLPKLEGHQKNPLICALPPYVQPSRLRQVLHTMPKLPELEFLDNADRIVLAKRIRKIRVPTKKFVDFYHEVYNLIVVGYEERNPLNPEDCEFTYDIADPNISIEELIASGKMPESNEDTTCEHMILTGISGVGKTALKNSVLKKLLPQTRLHTKDNFDEIQIIQLHAEMPHDGSRATLLKNLFSGIDKALKGFEENNYLKQVQPRLDRSASIGAMENFFRSLCIKYHVGIIVVDEFQNIEVADKGNQAKMRQFFDSMSNELNVPFLKIGTTDSLKLMKTKFTHARRAGDTIEIEPYYKLPLLPKKAGDKAQKPPRSNWNDLVKSLFEFQVIKKPITYSERWDEELYKLSCGIPYVLYTLWQEVQINAIRTGTETITFKRLNDVFKSRFKLIKTALTALRSKRLGQFQDLLTIAQLFDKDDAEAAIKRLNHFVEEENFSGAAASDILLSLEEVEQEFTLTEPQKKKLAKIKASLKERAATIKKGQVYENQA